MTEYQVISDKKELAKYVDQMAGVEEVALDTEFTSLSFYHQELIGISLFNPTTNIPSTFLQCNFSSTYTEKIKDPENARKKIDQEYYYRKTDALDLQDEEVLQLLMKLLYRKKIITANGKVELKVLSKYGNYELQIIDDVNMMSHLLDVSTPSDLKTNARKILGITMTSYEDTVGMKVNNINWNKVDFEAYGHYACKDAYATWYLRDPLREQINALNELRECYEYLEMPLIPYVARSEMKGVQIDIPTLERMSVEISKELETAANEVFSLAGVKFNLGSPKQVAEVLFDRLGLPALIETKSGGRSVGEDALLELAYQGYEIADMILDFRQLEKLKTTYIDKIPKIVDPDGRLRGSFNQNGTVTGRFSSSSPNLQNMPNNSRYPVKSAFVAKKGYSLIVVDWSTIEIRIMAHESQDVEMMDTLNNYRDVHQETTDRINAMTGLQLKRSDGKTANFAILYGMSAVSLSYTLNKELKKLVKKGKITEAEFRQREVSQRMAQTIIDGYYSAYYGFAQWGRNEIEHSAHTGWVWTLGGRRRPVPELRNKRTRSAGERIVVNTMIQGGAGDIMKLAIRKLFETYAREKYDAEVLLYIHDEYVIEVRDDQAEDCLKTTIEILQNIFPTCTVPILCEGAIFDNWDGLKSKADPKSTKQTKSGGLGVNNSAIRNLLLWQRR